METIKRTHIRFTILPIILFITVLSFADRTAISIAGDAISNDFGINHITLGYIFSAFGWTYALAQIPGGMLVDKFGPKKIYTLLTFIWSIILIIHSVIDLVPAFIMVSVFIVLRAMVGVISAPMFPINSRVVAEWFPSKERAMATSVYTSAQYLSVIIFAPLIGVLSTTIGWQYVFLIIGCMMLILSFVWMGYFDLPNQHRFINESERNYIQGSLGKSLNSQQEKVVFDQNPIIQLLKNRMTLGIYLGQYCSAVTSYFFMTWFPVFLILEKGLTVAEAGFYTVFPAIGGFFGSLMGGAISDKLVQRGYSLTFSRKFPIILGLCISSTIFFAIYIDSVILVVIMMTAVLWGRGFSGLGWTLITETVPKNLIGINSGIFNTFSNIAGITAPIGIGILVELTDSFYWPLVFVSIHCLLAIVAYAWIVTDLKELKFNYHVVEEK
ncbi:D-galactonate transporter [Lysinibacillus sp. PLM2]|nr:D-galactonate transporter [Lysinibacillus sp. PLM2]